MKVCEPFREVNHVTHQKSFPFIFVYLGVLFIFYAFVNIYMAYYLEIGLSQHLYFQKSCLCFLFISIPR